MERLRETESINILENNVNYTKIWQLSKEQAAENTIVQLLYTQRDEKES